MEVFFRVSFHRDFLQLINGLVLTEFNARSVLGILCPTNSLFCKGYILRICSKSGQNVLFHFVSICPKKIIHKEIDDSCHGFSCSWTSTCGIQRFFSNAVSMPDRSRDSKKASVLLCDGPLFPVFPNLLTRLSRIQHVNSIRRLVWEPCHSYEMPCQECSTSVGRHRSCHFFRFLQSCSNIRWMTCFWWPLTHDITILFLKGCFEINVEKIQLVLAAIWQLS